MGRTGQIGAQLVLFAMLTAPAPAIAMSCISGPPGPMLRTAWVVDARRVLALDRRGGITSFALQSGRVQWQRPGRNERRSWAAPWKWTVDADEGVLVLYAPMSLRGLDLETGRTLWTTPLDAFDPDEELTVAAVGAGTVVAQSWLRERGPLVVAFDLATGKERWRRGEPGVQVEPSRLVYWDVRPPVLVDPRSGLPTTTVAAPPPRVRSPIGTLKWRSGRFTFFAERDDILEGCRVALFRRIEVRADDTNATFEIRPSRSRSFVEHVVAGTQIVVAHEDSVARAHRSDGKVAWSRVGEVIATTSHGMVLLDGDGLTVVREQSGDVVWSAVVP